MRLHGAAVRATRSASTWITDIALADASSIPGIAALTALAAVAAVASWTDVRQRRIPNWLCAVNFVLGLAFAAYASGWAGAGMAALHVAVALAVTMALFAGGIIGAGDAKFYASMAAWLPIQQGLLLLSAVALAGLVLLIVFWLTRIRGRARRADAKDSPFDKLPYGVAVGLGGLAAVILA